MEIKFDVPLKCPDNIRPYLEKVFAGEYNIPIHIPEGAVIIDLGANFGSFSVWAAHRWPGAKIVGFEPHPEVFKVLRENTSAYTQIEVNNWGIGSPGMRVLNDGPNNDGERSFHMAMNMVCPTGIHCEVRDPLTLPDCDVLKMDIEGCEIEVLHPLIEAGKRPSIIMLEHHNHKLRREVDELLKDYDLIGADVYNILGLGVAKYMRRDLVEGILNASLS